MDIEQTLAREAILGSSCNVLIVGKAGTGKTTFLRDVVKRCEKKLAVVAPSGIAAIEAEGKTIHSFFGFNTAAFAPGSKDGSLKRLTQGQREWINRLELLIIDEISMVRADLLDHIDSRLRAIRHIERPFGGVQIVMIGDLKQLPPVVDRRDGEILDEFYDTGFFFESQAFRASDFLFIEFKKVYRQENERFVSLLNRVRDNVVTDNDLAEINKRYTEHPSEDYVQLVTHRWQAEKINKERMSLLPGKEYTFTGFSEGFFYKKDYPAPEVLSLKKGARVMFVKNNEPDGFVNGTFGVVKAVNSSGIKVCTDKENRLVVVERTRWNYEVSEFNTETNEVETRVVGWYEQYPLMPAWAITVHKSQGQTFDNVVLNLRKCFAEGQAYVALSRCRSLEGIQLSSLVDRKAIKINKIVEDFLEKMRGEWTVEAVKNAIIADQKKPKAPKLVYDKEWVTQELDKFRRAQAKIEKCTCNLIFNKHEMWYLANRAPKTKKEMRALSPNVDANTVDEYGDAILRIIKQGFKKVGKGAKSNSKL